MYLHIGQNIVIPETEIIGIFDLDNTTGSRITRQFLNDADKKGNVTGISDELPRSFIVSGTGNDIKIYLTQLSTQTLFKRAETMRFD